MAFRTGTISLQNDDDCSKEKVQCTNNLKQMRHPNYVHAPIDKFGVVGRWFRHKLLDGILVGTPVLLTIQKHRTPSRTIIMKTLSFLGTEDFYTALFLCLSWLFDPRLGRLFGLLMWIGFYITGFLKTLLCLPRPPCPPVIPLEKAFDWALPSHHSLLGVIMPWYIWLYTTLHYELSTSMMSLVCTLIVLWSCGVLLSRLYLGVHSPADIVCGGIVGVLILSMWMQVDDFVDVYISQPHLDSQLKLIVFVFLLLCVHPITEPGNPSYLDTCILWGVGCGIILGRSQRSKLLGMPSLMQTHRDVTLLVFLRLSMLRMILGGLIITVLRICLKKIFAYVIQHLYRFLGLPYFDSSAYRKSMPPNPRHYTKNFVIPPIHPLAKSSEVEDKCSDSSFQSCVTSHVDNDDEQMTSSRDTISKEDFDSRNWFDVMQIFNAIRSLTSKSEDPWDITIPSKVLAYGIITFTAVEIVPQAFTLLGI